MAFWAKLNSRERFIVGVGFPLTLLFVGYLYYWQPLVQDLNSLRQQIPKKIVELAWVEHKITQAGALIATKSVSSTDAPMLTVIEAQAIQSNIKSSIQRVQPAENQQVKMWFEDVIADHWLKFVEQLDRKGIAIESAIVSRTKKGRVNVRVTFKR